MNFLRLILIASLILNMNTNPAFSQPKSDARPNIIFILADDLTFDGVGAYGRSDVKTPNIDHLAGRGIRFTRYYNTTAICMASRATIMTGKFEFSTGCNFDRDDLSLDNWHNSYPSLLKKNGYITGFAGKLGFRVDESKDRKSIDSVKSSFDWWCGWPGQGKYEMSANREAEEYHKLYGNKKEHTTYALGLMGKAFIEKYADSKKPFCLSISFKAPHTPYHTDKRYDGVYQDHDFETPGNYGGAIQLPEQAIAGRPFIKGKSWMKDFQGSMQKYHQMVYGLDVAVGMILNELKSQGLDQNTVIIFTSDNGHFNGTKGLGGKLYPYEEGALAPLLYYDPRVADKKNGELTALSANTDIAPTILDIAEIAPPEDIQGKSLLPLIEGTQESIHESILLVNAWGARAAQSLAVVNENWKYIHWFYGTDGFEPEEELYNMQSDRLELKDLSEDTRMQSEKEKMRTTYDWWMEYWKDHCLPGSDYEYYPELAKRGADFTDIKRSHVLKMGTALTENNRKTGDEDRPNILFIMSDDHSPNAIGAYNSHLKDFVLTPSIDRLAKEGVTFTNAVCTNALCTPSRASILTGKYSHKSGVYTLREELNTAQIPTLPKLLNQNGYQTAVFGKWHIEGDNLHGFDNYAITKGQGAYVDPSFVTKEGKLRTEGHSTDVITDLSIDWLENRNSDEPFILFTHYKAAHGPWQYADRHKDLFEAQNIAEPSNLFDTYLNRAPEGVPQNQARIHSPGSKMSLSYWFQTNKKGKKGEWPTGQINLDGKSEAEKTKITYQKYVKDYMRCVKGIDEGVAKLIAYLRSTGELENTVIIYTSDQGMYLGEHNFFDKRLGLEEAMEIPLIIRYPKLVNKDTIIADLVNNVDITSTILDFAGISQPEEMQGISFKKLLEGKNPKIRREASFYAFYSNGIPKHYGVRTKRYKLLKYVGKDGNVIASDMFDLYEDPDEMTSLYSNPEYKILQETMENTLKKECVNVGIEEAQLPGK